MNDTVQNSPVNLPQPQNQNLGQSLANQLIGTQNSSSDGVTPKSNASRPVSDDVNEKLDTFESVLDDIQNTVPHGTVQALNQVTDTLNPQQPGVRTAKERIEPVQSPDTKAIDLSSGVQTVEHEKVPEIPVEVESFLQRVEDHQETAPTEVVIADGTQEVSTNQYPSRPVIVLPITQEEEQEGSKKTPKFSFRWLVEFSRKIVKMFTGKVIYRQEK